MIHRWPHGHSIEWQICFCSSNFSPPLRQGQSSQGDSSSIDWWLTAGDITLEVWNCTTDISRSSNPVILPFVCTSRLLGGFVKSQTVESYPQSILFGRSEAWDRARETCIFNKSQVMPMILVRGPHFENHPSNPLYLFTNEEIEAQRVLSLRSILEGSCPPPLYCSLWARSSLTLVRF